VLCGCETWHGKWSVFFSPMIRNLLGVLLLLLWLNREFLQGRFSEDFNKHASRYRIVVAAVVSKVLMNKWSINLLHNTFWHPSIHTSFSFAISFCHVFDCTDQFFSRVWFSSTSQDVVLGLSCGLVVYNQQCKLTLCQTVAFQEHLFPHFLSNVVRVK